MIKLTFLFKMSAMKIIFCVILALTLSINLVQGDSSEETQSSFEDELPVKLYERKKIFNVKSSLLDDLIPNQADESKDKIKEIKNKASALLEERMQNEIKNYLTKGSQLAQPRIYDPILEALILDSSDYLSTTGIYLLAYQHKAANLKRSFGGDGPDYFQGRIVSLLQSLEGVLYSAGATIEQMETLKVREFQQSTWYRLDYNREKFASASSLLYQLVESVNIDYLVPYSTRRPEFLLGVSEEFFYAYMSLAGYMSEQTQQLAIWQDLDHIETTALLLASELGVASGEIIQYTQEIRDIFTAKFDALNLARTKFYSAAMDAKGSVNGIVFRYNELTRPSN